MAQIIFPTENDVGVATNDGRAFTEANWDYRFNCPTNNLNYSVSGCDVASTATSPPTVTFNAGQMVINGYMVRETTNFTSPSLTVGTSSESVNNQIYYQITRSGGLVTGAQFVVQTGDPPGTPPTEALCLGEYTTDATSVTAQEQFLKISPVSLVASCAGSGGARQLLFGFKPSFCMVVDSLDVPFIMGANRDHAVEVKSNYTVSDSAFEDFGITLGANMNTSGRTIYFTAMS